MWPSNILVWVVIRWTTVFSSLMPNLCPVQLPMVISLLHKLEHGWVADYLLDFLSGEGHTNHKQQLWLHSLLNWHCKLLMALHKNLERMATQANKSISMLKRKMGYLQFRIKPRGWMWQLPNGVVCSMYLAMPWQCWVWEGKKTFIYIQYTVRLWRLVPNQKPISTVAKTGF